MSSSKIKFYIHPGLPKTASSFLEKLVFTQLKDKGWSFNDQHLLSVLKESLLKEKNDSQNLLQYLSKKKESNYLISYDALCGDPYASFEDRAAILNAISNLTNGLEIKILLTIRNQSDWVESIYKQSLHEYYYTPFNKFISWKSNRKKVPYPSLNIQCLNWYSLYCDLNKIAESKNICVLPLELMKKEPERFIDLMGNFFQEKLIYPNEREVLVNKGYGHVSCKLALFINPLLTEKSRFGIIPNRPFYYFLKARRQKRIYSKLFQISSKISVRNFFKCYVDRAFPAKAVLLTARQKEILKLEFKESNQMLGETVGHDLLKLGYYDA